MINHRSCAGGLAHAGAPSDRKRDPGCAHASLRRSGGHHGGSNCAVRVVHQGVCDHIWIVAQRPRDGAMEQNIHPRGRFVSGGGPISGGFGQRHLGRDDMESRLLRTSGSDAHIAPRDPLHRDDHDRRADRVR